MFGYGTSNEEPLDRRDFQTPQLRSHLREFPKNVICKLVKSIKLINFLKQQNLRKNYMYITDIVSRLQIAHIVTVGWTIVALLRSTTSLNVRL